MLLEGVSDVAAVRVLAGRRGIDTATDVRLIDLHGVTNVRRTLVDLLAAEPHVEVLGLCDAAEARFVLGALQAVGRTVDDVDDLATHGFFVCRVDLEHELIQALGPDRTVQIVRGLRLGPKLASLQQQPAWQSRALTDQLHRFCGVASGRKALMAGAMAAALTPEEVPEPLERLLARLDRVASSTPP